ncbi:hypothetical protein ACO1O0_002605 [Amphichorda felina]
MQMPHLAETDGTMLCRLYRDSMWGYLQPKFLGIESDPQWLEDLERWEDPFGPPAYELEDLGKLEMLPAGLARELVGFHHRCHKELRIVDSTNSTLRPMEGLSYGELVAGSIVFLAKDRRYVQVDMDDIGGRWRLVEGADIVDTVVYFADRMCEHLEDHAADMADDPEHTHELILISVVCLHEDWLEC